MGRAGEGHRRILSFFSFLSILTALLTVPAGNRLEAQTTNATILGTVRDSTGAVVSGAAIQVTNVATGVSQTTQTNAQGRYQVPDLLVGNYRVQATLSGFQAAVHTGITLTVGSQSVVDFTLQVGQAQQTVTVSGEVSQVQTTSSAVSSLVDQTQMRDLPLNGRNFTQLVTLSPGVSHASTGTSFYGAGQNFSIAGQRAEGQAVLLDNTDVNGFWNHGTGSGATGSSLGVEAVAEFQVLTNTYSAQFGGSGAVINAVTKSGTNNFHGSAYDFLRNSAMDARNFFDTTKPPFRQNQFGGSLGGPIKKDKLFFFGNYEAQRNALGQTGRAFVPDANAHQGMIPVNGQLTNVGVSPLISPILDLYPLPNGPEQFQNGQPTGVALYNSVDSRIQHENYILGRVDYTISDTDSIYFRYISDRADQIVPYSGSQIPLWPETDNTRNQYFTMEEKRVVNPSLVNLARFAFVRPVETAMATGEASALNFFPGLGRENGQVNPGSGVSIIGANTLIPYDLIQNKFTYADDVIWTKGNHNIKFGLGITRVQTNLNAPFIIGGSYGFPNLKSFLGGVPSTFLGVAPDQGDATRDFREIDMAPYIEDDWKVSPTLTLNLGFRWDYTTNPVGVRHPLNAILVPPSVNPQNPSTGFTTVDHVYANNVNAHNFDPRFGFAWDPFKDHKTSIRGGFGVFHDQIAPREYASGYYLSPPFSFGFQIAPSFPDPFPNYVPGQTATGPVTIIEGVNYQTTSAPYVMQYNLNIQREVLPNTVLTVGYVGSRGVHLTEQIDQNPPIPTIGPDGNQVFGSINPRSGTVTPNPRISPAFSRVNNGTTWGLSRYNSLQVSLNRRLTSNLTAQGSYTWSRCLDLISGSFGLEGAGNITDPYNASLDWGRCNYDINQNLQVNALYALPFKGNRVVSGWQVSGILSASSGPPFSVTAGFDQAGLQNSTPRANIVPGCQVMVRQVNEWYNPQCFTLPAVGELGNLGRNTFDGPGLFNTDFAVLKDTRIRESLAVQFRAEFFNIFNHANFFAPVTGNFTQVPFTGGGTINPLAGTINAAAPGREIQLALKVTF
jgi:outer membrane receptor protein involved in Fe transport